MNESVIDLRKIPKGKTLRRPAPAFGFREETDAPKGEKQEAPEDAESRETKKTARPRKAETLIAWRAAEYEKRARSSYWFIGIGAIATALIILGIFAKSYVFIAFVALAFVVLVAYAQRTPRELSFSITQKGVQAGNKFYPFSDLKSFWISDTPGVHELSVETKRALIPFVRLPLGDADSERIRAELGEFLPEKEHQEFLIDQIARGLGF